MEQRNVGSFELSVSAVGMGCNNFSRKGTATETLEGSVAVINAALDAGITFFDGADIYGSEPGRSESFLGAALKGRRDEVVLSTKFGFAGVTMPGSEGWGPKGSARYVRNAVDASLTRLDTDRIDLLQIHSPDPSTPIEETLGALSELVTEGKIRYFGHSNYSAEQARHAAQVAAEAGLDGFISSQIEYSLLHRTPEAELLPTAQDLGLGVFPYFPLANGLLTGKYTRDGGGEGRVRSLKPHLLETTNWDLLDAYQRICDEAGHSMLTVSIAWLLWHEPIASVIAGATRPDQVTQNAKAGSTAVSADVLRAVDELFA